MLFSKSCLKQWRTLRYSSSVPMPIRHNWKLKFTYLQGMLCFCSVFISSKQSLQLWCHIRRMPPKCIITSMFYLHIFRPLSLLFEKIFNQLQLFWFFRREKHFIEIFIVWANMPARWGKAQSLQLVKNVHLYSVTQLLHCIIHDML